MWRKPTTSDFLGAILEAEMIGLQEASAPNGKDITGDAIKEATGFFRNALHTGGKVVMGPDGTLPEEVIPKAMDYAVFRFFSRAGSEICEGRMTLFKSSETYRTAIRDGKEILEEPGTTLANSPIVAPKTIRRRTRLDPSHQRGI